MRTVLIVEDEYALAEIVGELLADEGYRVVLARNGIEGLERVRQHAPDIILLDVMMPLMNGREMLRRLRELPAGRDIPVVLMSAAALAMQDPATADLGPITLLRKPFQFDALLKAIATVTAVSGRVA